MQRFARFRKNLPQKFARVRTLRLCDLLRSSNSDHISACVSGLRPEIDNPVSTLDHFEVVLDHHDGMTAIDQPLK
jgi:hypothetical protein